jgi:hypothetical protein
MRASRIRTTTWRSRASTPDDVENNHPAPADGDHVHASWWNPPLRNFRCRWLTPAALAWVTHNSHRALNGTQQRLEVKGVVMAHAVHEERRRAVHTAADAAGANEV